jgi:hypothetical protein
MTEIYFEGVLKSFNSEAESLVALDMLTKKAETARKEALDNLGYWISKDIAGNCSREFVEELREKVSEKIRSANGYNSTITCSLDYLTNVICLALTKHSFASCENDGTLGFESFIAPGETYEESGDFCSKFFKDFIVLKEMFGLEMKHCPEVKIGYAYSFYKS